jgi:hypothetical protein
MARRVKTAKKRVNKKDVSALQAREDELRLHRRTAKKQAKEARRLLKEAKQVAKRAKAELQTLSKKLKKLMADAGAGGRR